jgi:hypothetical protein
MKVQYIDPNKTFLPHEYDLTQGSSDLQAVQQLARAFKKFGYDRNKPPVIAYPIKGKYQIL